MKIGVENCNEEEANNSEPETMTMPMTLMSVDGDEREKGEVLSLYGLKNKWGRGPYQGEMVKAAAVVAGAACLFPHDTYQP